MTLAKYNGFGLNLTRGDGRAPLAAGPTGEVSRWPNN